MKNNHRFRFRPLGLLLAMILTWPLTGHGQCQNPITDFRHETLTDHYLFVPVCGDQDCTPEQLAPFFIEWTFDNDLYSTEDRPVVTPCRSKLGATVEMRVTGLKQDVDCRRPTNPPGIPHPSISKVVDLLKKYSAVPGEPEAGIEKEERGLMSQDQMPLVLWVKNPKTCTIKVDITLTGLDSKDGPFLQFQRYLPVANGKLKATPTPDGRQLRIIGDVEPLSVHKIMFKLVTNGHRVGTEAVVQMSFHYDHVVDCVVANTVTNLYKFPVKGSMDPNYKLVLNGTTHKPGDWVTYAVGFTNDGNETEHDIIVKDTLNAAFDPATFTMLEVKVGGMIIDPLQHPTHNRNPHYTLASQQASFTCSLSNITLDPKQLGQITFKVKLKDPMYFRQLPTTSANSVCVEVGNTAWTRFVHESPMKWYPAHAEPLCVDMSCPDCPPCEQSCVLPWALVLGLLLALLLALYLLLRCRRLSKAAHSNKS